MTTRHYNCALAFSAALRDLAATDGRHCIVINDSAESHDATGFKERFPERMIDVGIAEQNMVGVAAGLANAGLIPWVHSASCFLTARAMEQIKNDVAYGHANVKLCGFISGLTYGELGGTHHSIEDIAWMRAVPGMRVLVPADANETAAAVRAAAAWDGPVFIRVISRVMVPELLPAGRPLTFGSAPILRDGKDVALIGAGVTTSRLIEAATLLQAAGISARVINMSSVSPIDADTVRRAATDTGALVVAEDHVLNGGLYAAVAEVAARTVPVPILGIGIPNVFAPVGSADFLLEHFGLTGPAIAGAVRCWLRKLAAARAPEPVA